MKKEFSQAILELAERDEKLLFITGDLGFNAFEGIRDRLGTRFINAGVAEQNMISVAAGMAYTGWHPWVYSIAPFAILKTFEQIRNDVEQTKMNVKIVGNGGGFGYGIMGNTHHLLEDIALCSTLPHLTVGVPAFAADVIPMVKNFAKKSGPAYVRLGLGASFDGKLPKYQSVRNILPGKDILVVVLGPLIKQTLEAISLSSTKKSLDVWSITQLPFEMPPEFFNRLKKAKKIVILEECTSRGGIGEHLLAEIAKKGLKLPEIKHVSARVNPDHKYGDQEFHLADSGLSAMAIKKYF